MCLDGMLEVNVSFIKPLSIQTEKSDLTVDALKLHNELQSGSLQRSGDVAGDAMEDQALTEKTSGTFLSGLSDCSNLTFRKVQRYWESNSAAHKEVCIHFLMVRELYFFVTITRLYDMCFIHIVLFFRSVLYWQP